METIKFSIKRMVTNDMCRIKAHDIRSIYRDYETGCISTLEILLAEMQYIKNDIKEKYGNDVIFEYED